MRIFVYEYLCARLPGSVAAALGAEGRAMLAAVLDDLARLTNVVPVTLLDGDCPLTPPGECVRQAGPGGEAERFRRLAADADWTLVIAPEFDDLLATRCDWVVEAGGRLLGSEAAAVRFAADKLMLGKHLQGRGVPTPPCWLLSEAGHSREFPLVCKPRYGAGSLATFLVRGPEELASCPQRARAEGWEGELLVQPFVPGIAASVAFLHGVRQQVALMPAAQVLSADGRFHYRGGSVPLPVDLRDRAVRLAARAVAVVSGLQGYVGVDLVLDREGNRGDAVLEINPRLTTSYVGLRALARHNLMGLLLDVLCGGAPPRPEWREGVIHFRADGSLSAV